MIGLSAKSVVCVRKNRLKFVFMEQNTVFMSGVQGFFLGFEFR
jgi:hypothetical protein